MRGEKTIHKRSLLRGREGLRFAVLIVLALVLVIVVVGAFDKFYGKTEEAQSKPIDVDIQASIPAVKREMLTKTVKEETKTQRYQAEPEAYDHMLQMAKLIVPGTLEAMGLSATPVPVDRVRKQPDRYRGRPLAYVGELHKITSRSALKTEGFIDFAPESGDKAQKIFFTVLRPVPKEIDKEGSLVRIAGLFFKLRDFQFPFPVERTPHIVGWELTPFVESIEPVTELDPKVLAGIHDAQDRPGEIQKRPFYHLCSFAMNRPADGAWKKDIPNIQHKDWESILNADGKTPRGKQFRVLAELFDVQIKVAPPNPLGVKFWTRAWVHHPHAKTIEVHIPGRADGVWHTGDFVVFYGAFMKRHWYKAGLNDKGEHVEKVVPLLVADKLDHWRLVRSEDDFWIKLILTVITVLLIGVVASSCHPEKSFLFLWEG